MKKVINKEKNLANYRLVLINKQINKHIFNDSIIIQKQKIFIVQKLNFLSGSG